MNIQLTEEQFSKLINQNRAETQKEEAPKLLTMDLYNKYLSSKKLSSYTIRGYEQIIRRFARTFPEFPTQSLAIDQYLATLPNTNKPNTSASYMTKRNHLLFIKSLIHFAVNNYDLKDYSKKLPKFSAHDPKGAERPYKTSEELLGLLNSTEGQHRLIILTLIDSGCRIGELGHTPEHPGLTIERVHPDQEIIEIYGKTGYHKMHCNNQLCELLIQNASTTGAIFHTLKSPDGISSESLRTTVAHIFTNHFKTGNKMGAHTIRHSVASLLADTFGNPLLVQNFIKHAKVTMSMEYIHSSEERKNKMPSPLKLINAQFAHANDKPKQSLLLSDGRLSTETDITIYDPNQQPIEQVEATIDLTEDQFNKVPREIEIRARLSSEDLDDMRKAYTFYARNADQTDPIPARLARRFNMLLKRTNPKSHLGT